MASVAIITAHSRFPWFRQLPGGGPLLDGMRFTLGEIAADCELLVVYDDPGAAFEAHLPTARRMVILSEPPGIRRYLPGYLEQFGAIMGPIETPGFSGRTVLSHPALPWFYGVHFGADGLRATETLDSLLAADPPEKRQAISVILSRKSQLPKHRARLKLVETLKRRLGDRLAIFGRGFAEIADKREAIAPFAYHLVLENNDMPHFWTEKTADAFLGWSLPLFSGAPNLGEYFSRDSFVPLDISDPARAAGMLENLLAGTLHADRLEDIRQARIDILTRYNLFPILKRLAGERFDAPREGVSQTILPNAHFATPLDHARKVFSKLAGR